MRAIFNRCTHRCSCGDRCIKKKLHRLNEIQGKHEYAKRGIHYQIVRENLRARPGEAAHRG